MDNFIVSARKYRPATFETVVGQQHITNTLKNAIKNNQLAQAFLFCGPRGVGKTTCARILAKTINCTNLKPNGEACGECASCKAFENGNSFNVHELDAASNNSVDDIRSLIEQVRIPPQAARYKVYIIDEVHMLSQAAFNAFLKTLEEPPHYAIFILATTEKHKILPTILSRCQIFDFNRIRVEDTANHLASIAGKESIGYEPDGLHIIAQKADGGLRDALSMFDQIVSFSGGKVTYRSVIDNLNILDYDYYFNITESLLKEDTAKVLLFFDEILSRGFDGAHFIAGLSEHFRNLLVGKDQSTLKLLEVSEGIKTKYLQQSQQASVSFLLSAMNIANQCDISYKLSKNQRLQVELALLKMCHLPSVFNLATTPLTVTSATDGGLKKKPDTSTVTPVNGAQASPAVSIVSEAAPVYSAPPKEVVTPSVQVKETITSPAEKPKIVMPLRSTLTPSLTGEVKTQEELLEEEDPYLKGEDKEDFTMDAFLQCWSDFAAFAKKEGKKTLLTVLTAGAPRMLKPYVFEVIVGNMVQENIFRDEKPVMLNYLRSTLKNFTIEVNARVDEQKVVRKPYTAPEKFQHMAARNPQLLELKSRFNLDFD
ncbi:DNA polymerase III subunit gamma/tau [Mucilaginibacter rubeus]|uniref:DNA polymerase III subunit gamma/tau n=1 Tax=Mucilaginibacter rubeus TaxID=2027860 RepID=A0AAE6MG31_9SPHI|nr:DNA polymerase III subunit gamma/tau [Mucilaginibacter rubeus]QEM02088.1 DNA polymerase III subunit gamma/tau [Mucilaginibacter rubeus]QTE42578.1 DNA polymerase III subunit gamma/tau [Mucilaginibacter rubeus]QTE49179.1 DNA polymerase III subunit gamma/tau [Mucilaginibacter rubeus]QTE54277.1 DNA polymerase III subunit gamma/tau [Mucilaginibacter rubeus]QTE66270.1 DNA polymerase III subunit gamma/tau [Mucilaginibacter rubeus]